MSAGLRSRWITTEEAADYARVSTLTVRRAIKRGLLQAAHVNGGRSIRTKAEYVDRWLERSEVPSR